MSRWLQGAELAVRGVRARGHEPGAHRLLQGLGLRRRADLQGVAVRGNRGSRAASGRRAGVGDPGHQVNPGDSGDPGTPGTPGDPEHTQDPPGAGNIPTEQTMSTNAFPILTSLSPPSHPQLSAYSSVLRTVIITSRPFAQVRDRQQNVTIPTTIEKCHHSVCTAKASNATKIFRLP